MKKFWILFSALMILGCSSAPAKTKIEMKVETTEKTQQQKEEEETKKKRAEMLGITTSTSNAQIQEKQTYTPSKPSILEDNEESIIVKVEGVGAIQNGNYAKARDEAIWDAQRRAVEKGVGVMLASETVVANAQLLSRQHIHTGKRICTIL